MVFHNLELYWKTVSDMFELYVCADVSTVWHICGDICGCMNRWIVKCRTEIVNSNSWPCLWSCWSTCPSNPQTLCQVSIIGRFSRFWSFARSLLHGIHIVFRRFFGLSTPRNLFISRQWLGHCTEPEVVILYTLQQSFPLTSRSHTHPSQFSDLAFSLSSHRTHIQVFYSSSPDSDPYVTRDKMSPSILILYVL